jgi:prevent-host-death family protein
LQEKQAPKYWKLYDAKNQLSHLVAETAKTPQVITVRGKEAAVLVSWESWENEKKEQENKNWFSEFCEESSKILDGGLSDEEYAEFEKGMERDKSTKGRAHEIDFSSGEWD